MADETVQPTDLQYITRAEFDAGLDRIHQRIAQHIDAKMRETYDKTKTHNDALEARLNDVESARHSDRQSLTRIDARLEVVLSKLDALNDLQTRFNDLHKRVDHIDDNIDEQIKPHINDIEKRGALTMEAVKYTRESVNDLRESIDGIGKHIDAQATLQKSSIDAMTKSFAPHLEWIEKRRDLENRVVSFASSRLGMVLLTAGATVLFGNNGLQLIELIFGG